MSQAGRSGTSENAFQYLNDGIRNGRWKPGEKLPSEAQLCKELGMSRTSVRSAIGRLAGLGLVQSMQGKGTFITENEEPDHSDTVQMKEAGLLDIYEFRKIIESESAALAAIRATPADIKEMEETIEGMSQETTAEEVVEQDMRFHRLIARASGNAVVQGVFSAMQETYEKMFRISVAQMHDDGFRYHRQILLAIQTRNVENARKCMLEHLENTMRIVCGS